SQRPAHGEPQDHIGAPGYDPARGALSSPDRRRDLRARSAAGAAADAGARQRRDQQRAGLAGWGAWRSATGWAARHQPDAAAAALVVAHALAGLQIVDCRL